MTWDIYVIPQTESEQRRTLKIFEFAPEPYAATDGVRKMVQRWVKCLLTKKGSDYTNTGYGTNYSDLIQGNFGAQTEVREAVQIAVDAATKQVQELDTAQDLADSARLASATLTEFAALVDGFEATVELVNAEGNSAVIPISSLDRV